VNPLRLRTRLALVFTSGFAVLLGLGALAFWLYLARSYRQDFDHTLIDSGRTASALFGEELSESGSLKDAAVHLVGELAFRDRTILVFDSAGRVLAVNQRVRHEAYFDDVPPAGPPDRPGTEALREGPARVLRLPVDGGVSLAIAMSALPLEHRLLRLREALGAILPLILLVGAMIGAWGSGLVLRPIVRVAESAERIGNEVMEGKTRFERMPPMRAGDELTKLTDAFNLMVDRLSAAFERERGVTEQQRRFLADAAHELRTPVAILRSEAEVTLRGDGDVSQYRLAMERVAAEASEMGMLVGDLLLIARDEAQAIVPARQKLYLDDLVNDVLARARVLPVAAGREMRRGEFEAAPVLGDPSLLERLLLVLVHNALLHAPGSTVEVSTGIHSTAEGSWSWVTVRDFGPGIRPEDRERIFERFARLNPAVSGTGLGLAIARSIAKAHGGTLTLEGPAPGAAFTLKLPQG